VVSSVRKVWKLPASVVPVVELRLELDDEDDDDDWVVPETTVGAVVAFVTVMSNTPHTLISTPLLEPSMRP
jgi:hypothetical protein